MLRGAPKRVMLITPQPPPPPVQLKMTKKKEVDKHQANVASIITSSNATPIRSWGGLGFTCSFCPTNFFDPAQLKKHTLTAHGDDEKSMFMQGYSIINFIVKLDVTDLQCKLCGYAVDTLEGLEHHLTSSHHKVFHKDCINHIVPFRFDDADTLRCAICRNEFNNFKVLLEHMNKHFRNYVCDVCDSGFVNQRMLQTHSYRHKKGEFICPQCSKVFDNKVKQKEHERAVHVSHNKRSKCGYCEEKFSDYTKKNDHMVKVHGAKALVLKCQACNKIFDNQRSLTVHTKSYHLLEGRLKK
ncbi:protein suppressor of hairy wing-like [Ostrinia furnacalis]|uniref:protein suppressor of hairy wing-like n=1 Tax=Ostrinia furnacalis TaxID=93504 RepID=UPI001038DBE5|nr:protein suppressor of hairy wing-like [Ostrinia furnacalis]XP_028163044.1 protein suppressor of hairy wing-like [Ostrinia furnacalis]